MASKYLTNSTKSLERLIALIRQNADEPTVDAKYSDDDLVLRIEAASQAVLSDINTCNDAPVMVRHNITLTSGSEIFRLPPNVQCLQEIAKVNAATGLAEWWIRPNSRFGSAPGVRIEGQTLRFIPKWQAGTETVRLTYVPSGDVRLHHGTAGAVTANTVVLAATPTLGSLDSRENAYLGCVLRIVSADTNGYVQERLITAYDQATRTATLEHALTDVPTGTITYEIIPGYGRLLESVIAAMVARDLQRINGNQVKVRLLNDMYVEYRRIARQQVARLNGMLDLSFEHDARGAE